MSDSNVWSEGNKPLINTSPAKTDNRPIYTFVVDFKTFKAGYARVLVNCGQFRLCICREPFLNKCGQYLQNCG